MSTNPTIHGASMVGKNTAPRGLAGGCAVTPDAGLPDGVGVAEAGDDVAGDGEGELEPVGAALLEREPGLLALGLRRHPQLHVRPAGGQDGQARDLHVRLQRLCSLVGDKA